VKTIAITSQKGGVGKTTVSINLAYSYAKSGKKVLLVDVDPQGSVGLSLTKKSGQLLGFYDYLTDPEVSVNQLVVRTKIETMSIITAGLESVVGAEHASSPESLLRIKQFIEQLKPMGFDLILIDTAAGLFGVSADIIKCVDAVLVPQQSEPLGIRSVPKMLESLVRLREFNPKLHVLGIVLTMVQPYLKESVEAGISIRNILPKDLCFHVEIPRHEIFLKASARGLPIGVMSDGVSTSEAFEALRGEVEAKLI